MCVRSAGKGSKIKDHRIVKYGRFRISGEKMRGTVGLGNQSISVDDHGRQGAEYGRSEDNQSINREDDYGRQG